MGRHLAPAGHGRARRSIAAAGAITAMLLMPAMSVAHPLGNFTINHYAEVRVEPGRVLLDVVVDQAEVAAFQARQGFDDDADGSVSEAEIEAAREPACEELSLDLRLTADEVELDLRITETGLSFPPGVGGLSTMRLVCGFEAALPGLIGAEPTRIAFSDDSYPNRLGWREIVVRGSGVTTSIVEGELRSGSISARLTAYPEELIPVPLADTSVAVLATTGGAELGPFDIPDAEPPGEAPSTAPPAPTASAPDASAAADGSPAATASPIPTTGAVPGGIEELPGIFRQDLTPVVVLLSVLAAAALGAGHALTPGHGKTLMAAYLVGTRGTPLHALALGLSVSVSHTVGILLLAGLVLGAADVVAADVVVRWAPLVAAISIVAIGGWMLIGELRRRRTARVRAALLPSHRHEDHGHEHEEGHDHDHGLEHSHGLITHSHAPAPGSTITWRSLFVLGLAGGLIPSTSALLILLSSIAAGRPAFGVVLVVAFGLGMAAVMSGIGLVLVAARDRLDRLPTGRGFGLLRESIPLVAAVVVFSFGVYLTIQSLSAV